jgi:hypothetical protein
MVSAGASGEVVQARRINMKLSHELTHVLLRKQRGCRRHMYGIFADYHRLLHQSWRIIMLRVGAFLRNSDFSSGIDACAAFTLSIAGVG